ncbi:MAG: hypothetical protein AAGU76_11440 [Sedimentibacter sp.]|uniref:hypothetical protein n=1 Tax=Sedimentibacter sp. TaxID=1960295 RepID=UPI0031598E66
MAKYKYMFLLMFAFLLLTVREVAVIQFGRMKRKDSEIISLNKKFSIVGFMYLVFLVFWIVLTAINVLKVYHLLKYDYVDSIFQMFNLSYMDNLIEGFFNNNDHVWYLRTYDYMSNLTNGLYWMFFSLNMSLMYCYRGSVGTIIYEEGITDSGNFFKWEKFKGYYSCGPYKKSFNEETYYKFIFNRPTFFSKDNTLVLNVHSEYKEAVEKAVSVYVQKTEEQ